MATNPTGPIPRKIAPFANMAVINLTPIVFNAKRTTYVPAPASAAFPRGVLKNGSSPASSPITAKTFSNKSTIPPKTPYCPQSFHALSLGSPLGGPPFDFPANTRPSVVLLPIIFKSAPQSPNDLHALATLSKNSCVSH